LRARSRLTYEVTIIADQNADPGIWRVPNANDGVRNYYLIVEAIGTNGRPIPRAITSEEDGTTATVALGRPRFGSDPNGGGRSQ
jgi:hypothetical protein